MALTLRHWVAAAALGCAVLAVGFLPPQVNEEHRRGWTPDLKARSQIGRALHRDYQVDLYLSRRDEALAQLRRNGVRSGSGPAVLVDSRRARGVSVPRLHALEAAVDSTARSLAPFDTGIRTVIFATTDTDRVVPGPGGSVGLRGALYIFPEATDGRTCLVLLPMASRSSPTPTDNPAVLGPCAYYAAFGRPGPSIAAWLRAVDYYPADEPDWVRSRPAFAPPDFSRMLESGSLVEVLSTRARDGLTLLASACAAGRLDRCRALLDAPPWYTRRQDQRGMLAFISQKIWWPSDDEQQWYLADLVRVLGRDRFARFWRSPLPRDTAFAQTYGMSMQEWTHRWLAGTRPHVQVGPSIRTSSVLLGILFAMMLVAGGAAYTTRRQIG